MPPAWLSGAVVLIVLVQALQFLDPHTSDRLAAYAPTWDSVSAAADAAGLSGAVDYAFGAGGLSAAGVGNSTADDIAVVLAIQAPVDKQPLVLERIYELSKDIAALPPIKDAYGYNTGGRYRLAVVVEHSHYVQEPLPARTSRGVIETYINLHKSDVPYPAAVMDVAPNSLARAYNASNATMMRGGATVAVPSMARFLKQYPQFKFAWRVEGDVNVAGRETLGHLLRKWDAALLAASASSGGGGGMRRVGVSKSGGVDLAGEAIHPPSEANQTAALNKLFREHCLVENCGSNGTNADAWKCYSRSIARYSRRFAAAVREKIRAGQYRGGECYLGALVQQGGFMARELSGLLDVPEDRAGGWDRLTAEENGSGAGASRGGSMTRNQALKQFMNDTDLGSYVYREAPVEYVA